MYQEAEVRLCPHQESGLAVDQCSTGAGPLDPQRQGPLPHAAAGRCGCCAVSGVILALGTDAKGAGPATLPLPSPFGGIENMETYKSQAEFAADKGWLTLMSVALDADPSELRLDACRTWLIRGKQSGLGWAPTVLSVAARSRRRTTGTITTCTLAIVTSRKERQRGPQHCPSPHCSLGRAAQKRAAIDGCV